MNLLKKIAIYTLAGLCFLGGFEWYMRFKGYTPEPTVEQHVKRYHDFDPVLGWHDTGPCKIDSDHNSSKAEVYWHDRGFYKIVSSETPSDHQIYSTHWIDGSRASCPSVRKRAPYRVLLLGCSNTYGTGVEDYETYAWLLNERFPQITIDNFALPGYSTYQCLLREEQLLKKKSYDLVIYAGIEHHLMRNLAYCLWEEKKFEGLTPPSGEYDSERNSYVSALKIDEPIWYYPTVYLKGNNTLGERYAYRCWPGDNYSSLINTAKRLFIFYETRHKKLSEKYAKIGAVHREIYRQLLERMNECAQRHKAKFAVVVLDNPGNANLALEPSFPYIFATDGRNGEEDSPKFHVAGNTSYHGNYLVHKNWADNISQWLEEWLSQLQCNS